MTPSPNSQASGTSEKECHPERRAAQSKDLLSSETATLASSRKQQSFLVLKPTDYAAWLASKQIGAPR